MEVKILKKTIVVIILHIAMVKLKIPEKTLSILTLLRKHARFAVFISLISMHKKFPLLKKGK